MGQKKRYNPPLKSLKQKLNICHQKDTKQASRGIKNWSDFNLIALLYFSTALNRAKQLIEKFQRHPNKDLLGWYHEILMGYLSRDVIGLPDPE